VKDGVAASDDTTFVVPALASDLLSDALDHPCRTTSRCRSRSRSPRRRSAAPNGRP